MNVHDLKTIRNLLNFYEGRTDDSQYDVISTTRRMVAKLDAEIFQATFEKAKEKS